MVSPLISQANRKKMLGRGDRMGSALFDQDNVILSDGKKVGESNNALITPGSIMGRLQTDTRPHHHQNEFDGLMRMNTGKSGEFEDDFQQMLNGNNGLEIPKMAVGASIVDDGGLRTLHQQDSMGGFQNIMNMLEPKAGNTGTTPSNDYGNLLMNRNTNISFDLRGPSSGINAT